MHTPTIPDAESAIGELERWVRATRPGPRSLKVVTGGATTGKSWVLERLGERLRRSHVILPLSAPRDAGDAGALLMVQAAVTLGGSNGLVRDIQDPGRTWREKLKELVRAVHARSGELLILYDEPALADDTWATFENHAQQVAQDFLFNTKCLRIAALSTVPPNLARICGGSIRLTGKTTSAFLDPEKWPALGSEASIIRGLLKDSFAEYTPLLIRLLVGIAALRGADAAADCIRRRASRRDLAQALATAAEDESLRQAWARLSLERTAFDESLLDCLEVSKLDPKIQAVIKSCLLFKSHTGWVLHEMLRSDPQDAGWLNTPQQDAVHDALAAYHHKHFERRSAEEDVARSLRHEMEVFHHYQAAARMEEALQLNPWFVEQLNALGRQVSRRRSYDDAVLVYDRALLRERNDGYANHYLAFNLDVQGKEPRRVKDHYHLALQADPHKIWYHGRYVEFLITLGQEREARLAWDRALDQLKPTYGPSELLYDELHRWVAALLLYRGRLEFARAVLEDVPGWVFQQNSTLEALEARLRLLEDADENGAVFPGHVSRANCWAEPQLLFEFDRSGQPRVRWEAGQVRAMERDSLDCLVAGVTTPGDPPRYRPLTFSRAAFNQACPDVTAEQLSCGQFIEVGYYGEHEDPIIRVHPARRKTPNYLHPAWDTKRYLKANPDADPTR